MEGTEGDEIRSVTRGVVSFAGPFTSFGKIILVKGDAGYLYGYAGAEEVLVQPGDRVDVGTVIGRVGFSPAFEAVRVLFTVWHRNRYVDPESAPRG
jgi:septal ring factor EnvC (AmiA/AmiB activator)